MPQWQKAIYLLQKRGAKYFGFAKIFSNIAKTSSNEFRRKKLQVPSQIAWMDTRRLCQYSGH